MYPLTCTDGIIRQPLSLVQLSSDIIFNSPVLLVEDFMDDNFQILHHIFERHNIVIHYIRRCYDKYTKEEYFHWAHVNASTLMFLNTFWPNIEHVFEFYPELLNRKWQSVKRKLSFSDSE